MKTTSVQELGRRLGVKWFDYQLEAFDRFLSQKNNRMCLFFRTGSGKTLTSLACLKLAGVENALIIAPLSTTEQWEEAAAAVEIKVEVITHQKFLQPTYTVPKVALVVDEFHMLGGLKGVGWKKLRANSDRRLDPVIVMSATPYWNSAERVFCAKRIVEGFGDYRTWLLKECLLEPDPYSILPKVVGFKDYEDKPNEPAAAQWLDAQPWVSYLPDTREVNVIDIPFAASVPESLELYGLDYRRERICASMMEERHARKRYQLIDDRGDLDEEAWETLVYLVGQTAGPVLMYCDSSQVAKALTSRLDDNLVNYGLLTGQTPKPKAQQIRERFRRGELDVLVGTATMRTGTDGFDKVCDVLIIVDDTPDPSARQQLIGRILPRGADAPIDNKLIWRLVPS